MTDQLSPLAVQNAPLLRAIDKGPYGSRAELAGAADILASNLNRKLDSLVGEGLIAQAGEATYEVELTDLARRALAAIDVFDGKVETPAPVAGAATTLIPLDQIDFSPFNPRKDAPDSDIPGLAASIADKGVLDPIMVRTVGDRFELVDGERRVRAARYAIDHGLMSATFAIAAQIREMSDEEAFEVAGVKNIQREDMHWMDEAQWYLRLHTRAVRPRSAAEILHLVGEGNRKKRSVQDYIKIAAELSAEDKARCYLPESDTNRLSVQQCKFIVGNRREKPALELSPKMALAMIELICASRDHDGYARLTHLHKRPQGGALTTLSDRGLITFGVDSGRVVAVIRDSDDLTKWLTQVGYLANPEIALRNIRAAAIGELSTARLAPGTWSTPELNPSERAEAPATFMGEDDGRDEIDDDGDPFGGADDDGGLGREIGGEFGGDHHADDPLGGAAETNAAAPAARIEVAPSHALVISELAHKLMRDGETFADGAPRVSIRQSYYKDPVAQAMIHDRLLMFLTQGPSTYAALTPRAYAWLEQVGVEKDEDGRFVISDDSLRFQQLQLGLPAGRHTYMTDWLRPNAEELAAAHGVRDDAEAGVSGHGASALVGDAFSQQVREVAAESRTEAMRAPTSVPAGTLQRLLAAAREAKRLVELGTTTRLKSEHAALGLSMLNGAMDDAERALQPKAVS